MTPTELAQKLIDDGYMQVSRSGRLVAKLPDGKTGKEALFEATMRNKLTLGNRITWELQTKQWVNNLGEESCKSQYLRVYGDFIQLTSKVFNEFRRLGGKVA